VAALVEVGACPGMSAAARHRDETKNPDWRPVAAPAQAAAPRRLTRPASLTGPHRRHPRLPPPVRLIGALHTIEADMGRIVESRRTTELPDGVPTSRAGTAAPRSSHPARRPTGPTPTN
jgi:hypothetical protein